MNPTRNEMEDSNKLEKLNLFLQYVDVFFLKFHFADGCENMSSGLATLGPEGHMPLLTFPMPITYVLFCIILSLILTYMPPPDFDHCNTCGPLGNSSHKKTHLFGF